MVAICGPFHPCPGKVNNTTPPSPEQQNSFIVLRPSGAQVWLGYHRCQIQIGPRTKSGKGFSADTPNKIRMCKHNGRFGTEMPQTARQWYYLVPRLLKSPSPRYGSTLTPAGALPASLITVGWPTLALFINHNTSVPSAFFQTMSRVPSPLKSPAA